MAKNPLPNLQTYQFKDVPFKQLMQNRIYNILIVCSNYDFYLLEEDGRIDEQIFEEYTALNLRNPPNFLNAYSTKSALVVLASNPIDLVIIWLDNSKHFLEVSNHIKEKYNETPIVALSYHPGELRLLLNKNKERNIDYIFNWNGSIQIFITIIKLVEDHMNAEKDINEIGVKAILLVEDSIKFYSHFLQYIYKTLLEQTHLFAQDGLNEHRKIMSKRGRPKVLLAKDYEEAIALFEQFQKNILGIITDVNYPKNGKKEKLTGFQLINYIRGKNKNIPFIVQSSDAKSEKIAQEYNVKFLHKKSETLGHELQMCISRYFSFGDFEFWDPTNKVVIKKAYDLKRFQKGIFEVPIESIIYHAKRNDFSKWLQSRALFPLAELFTQVSYNDFSEDNTLSSFLSKAVSTFRKYRSRGVIVKFNKDQYDEHTIFSRIGNGSLGGKGRGLAFIDLFIKRHKLLSKKYKHINISIPRSVVLSTAVFDSFMEENDLLSFVTKKQDDTVLLKRFISEPLPEWVIEDIKAFLQTVDTPIAIRSSSVLEDSLHQPFAGVFSTYMIPNTTIDLFLEMVSNAIKSVMASAFYKNSKAYIKATNHSVEENKMAVVLQEVIGTQYHDFYYPNISGVARSINFYPLGNEKSEEGIANIALGLGEIIVGGGQTLRFSPAHPKNLLQLSSTKTALKDTQKHFFGLDMNPKSYQASSIEASNIKKINLRQAKNHKSLKFVASTYDMHSKQIRSGTFHEGARILTFENILKNNSFPLAEILKDLLRIGQREIRNPIEMEFAVDLDVSEGEPKVFSFLQIRPIVENKDSNLSIPKNINLSDTIIFAESALGNGKYRGIYDLVYIKQDNFDAAKTTEIALSIEKLNDQFEDEEKYYILIGPGRWGSSDPWLGIPINWGQISRAKVIVESGLENFNIDPSQGTHFFQNLTSLNLGYLTINPFINDGFLDSAYINKQKTIYEDKYIKHIRFNKELSILIDGKNNKAVIFKEGISIADIV